MIGNPLVTKDDAEDYGAGAHRDGQTPDTETTSNIRLNCQKVPECHDESP